MRLGVARALVDGTWLPGDVEIADDRVAAVGVRPAGGGGAAVPGLIDTQVNGFAGVDLLGATPADLAVAGAGLAAAGVTAWQPTLISAPEVAVQGALRVIAGTGDVRGAGPGGPRVLGAHLEGPFLSPAWPGAHPPQHLRAPDPALLARLLAAGPVRRVTLAPELPGGLTLLAALVAAGVVVSVGHSDADAPTAHRAFDAGASAITHLYNAHRRWTARDPGPAGAALARTDVAITVIADGAHLAADTLLATWRTAGLRLVLISDAITAAGTPAATGEATLGDDRLTIVDGAARLADGRLAGSATPLDAAVRVLHATGVPLAAALHAATRAPALLAGYAELGRLRPGAPADIAVLDDELRVRRTLVAGREVHAG